MWYVGCLLISTFDKNSSFNFAKSNISFSSFNFSKHFIKISHVAFASSTALWWFSKDIPKCFATILSLTFLSSGYKNLASGTVSIIVKSNSKFILLQLFFINPVSKAALCATNTLPLQNSRNLGNILSIVSLSLTISSVIPVSSVILYGINFSGFTNSLNLSTIFPSSILTAPISIILSFFAENPVVSRSNTT